MLPISDRLGSYLKSWHKTSTTRQMGKGRVVELTYTDFLSLFTPGQLMGLEWAIQNDTLRRLQNAKSSDALVLTWRNYEAVATGHFNTRTAMICSRKTSEEKCRMMAGDTHTAETKARISKAKTGKRKQRQPQRETSAKATKGVSKSAWTPERKAARRSLIAAKKAAKAASKD